MRETWSPRTNAPSAETSTNATAATAGGRIARMLRPTPMSTRTARTSTSPAASVSVKSAVPADFTLTLAAGLVLVLAVRVLIGVGLNIRAILPPAVAAVAFVLVSALGAFVLGDQVSRMRFLSY